MAGYFCPRVKNSPAAPAPITDRASKSPASAMPSSRSAITPSSALRRAAASADARMAAALRSSCSIRARASDCRCCSAAVRSATDRHGAALVRSLTPALRRNPVISRADTAKKNSASLPSEIEPKLLRPITRPQASTSGPPLLPAPSGAVCNMVSNWRAERPPEIDPRVLTGDCGRMISSTCRPCARSTVLG